MDKKCWDWLSSDFDGDTPATAWKLIYYKQYKLGVTV